MAHPPGWYADPYTPPGYAPGVRWWDGEQWTDHAHPQPVTLRSATDGWPATPDGDRLAGWGVRLGAYVIDSLVILAAAVVVGFPLVTRIGDAYADLFRDIVDATGADGAPPDQLDIYSEIGLPLIEFGLLTLALNFVYHVAFLRWRAATPGKLLLGLQVRLREQPGPLSWGTILRRWLAQFGPNLLSLLPFLGMVAGLYPWVDGLWPLWDERRQALHDKFARTNVIRTRPG